MCSKKLSKKEKKVRPCETYILFSKKIILKRTQMKMVWPRHVPCRAYFADSTRPRGICIQILYMRCASVGSLFHVS